MASIACEGDVQATPGSTPFPPAVSGAWSAGTVQYTSYSNHTVQGDAVIWQALCTFNFSGTGPPPAAAPVAGVSAVTLTAKSEKYLPANKVLVNGDSIQDVYGNTLKVSSARTLDCS